MTNSSIQGLAETLAETPLRDPKTSQNLSDLLPLNLFPSSARETAGNPPRPERPAAGKGVKVLHPSPRQTYYENNSPEYCYVIWGVATAKLRNYQEIDSPRIILRNWQMQRPQTLPCCELRKIYITPEKIILREFFS